MAEWNLPFAPLCAHNLGASITNDHQLKSTEYYTAIFFETKDQRMKWKKDVHRNS